MCRKITNHRARWLWKLLQPRSVEHCADFASGTRPIDDEAVRKIAHTVSFCRTSYVFAAVTEVCERPYRTTHHVQCIDLSARILPVADDDRRPAYVFKSCVLNPQFFCIACIDRDGTGNVSELIMNQCQPGFMFLDGRLTLALKA